MFSLDNIQILTILVSDDLFWRQLNNMLRGEFSYNGGWIVSLADLYNHILDGSDFFDDITEETLPGYDEFLLIVQGLYEDYGDIPIYVTDAITEQLSLV